MPDTSAAAVRARHVVGATGPFSLPRVPAASAGLSPEVVQLHCAEYRRLADSPHGELLGVGGGQQRRAAGRPAVLYAPGEGRRAARALVPAGAAAGRRPVLVPALSGVLDARCTSRVVRIVQRRGDPLIGTELRDLIRCARVRLLTSRVVAANGRSVRPADDSDVPVSSVLWCTGFRPDTRWIDLPGTTDADGTPVHVDGASPVPGLHWMGLPWQTRLDSAIVHGVAADARALTARVRRLSAPAVQDATSTR